MNAMPRSLVRRITCTAIVAAVTWSSPARACSCTNEPDFAQAFASSHTVFIGEVLAIRPAPEYGSEVWVLLSVEGWWKGAPPHTTIEIRTGADDGVCGVGFDVGERWIVFALQSQFLAPHLWTHSCWRTHEPYDGDPDLAALGPVPAKRDSWGSLKISYR